MNKTRVFSEFDKLHEALWCRRNALRLVKCYQVGLALEGHMANDEKRCHRFIIEATAKIAASVAAIRAEAGDDRFDAFSDDELLLAVLKLGSQYYDYGYFSHSSTALSEIFGPGQPERLATLIDALIIRKTSPLNKYLRVRFTSSLPWGGYGFTAIPRKLNALFWAKAKPAKRR